MTDQNALILELKEGLLVRRQELVDRLERIKADISKPLDHDFAEQAVEQENGEVLEALGHEAEVEIRQINHALISMEEGSYGACDECGVQIPEARLKVAPYSSCCVKCATNNEQKH
ncbi:MAG: TraR/DksA family transcriptional regulator [Hahellaceae bacterium]|nr:TraR/DksA family transcriptional regulator [Hahellaceae bacterium]MCP5170521.1 TraR/DksA family transcriptional regulator [Hahellaceae bacterium]